MLKSRLRCAHSCFDGTANPADPHHFVKTFIDSDADVFCQTSTIDDNPFLPTEFVENLKREYAGTVYYNRFILGQWMAAEGIIYRPFADSIAAGDRRFYWPPDQSLRPWRVQIGVDFGGNGSKHAFVATGILPGYEGIVGLASQMPRGRTPRRCARHFWRFARRSSPSGVRSTLSTATTPSRCSSSPCARHFGRLPLPGCPVGCTTPGRRLS